MAKVLKKYAKACIKKTDIESQLEKNKTKPRIFLKNKCKKDRKK